jgi:8-oxo-dGTP pyrophosphatase MutT (NUDIX family)
MATRPPKTREGFSGGDSMKRSRPDPGMPSAVSEPQQVYRCPFLEIHHSSASFPSFSKEYYVVKFKPRGGVVATRDGSVLMTKQYRYLLRNYSWELPGGSIESSEDAESAIIRECYEETGVRVSRLETLIRYYPGLDNVDNKTTVFAARSVDAIDPFHPDPREISEIAWIPLGSCIQMIWRGEIQDAMSVAGLLAYRLRHEV